MGDGDFEDKILSGQVGAGLLDILLAWRRCAVRIKFQTVVIVDGQSSAVRLTGPIPVGRISTVGNPVLQCDQRCWIGYDQAAAVSKKAYESGKTIRQVVLDENLLGEKEFDEWLQDQFK